MALVVARFWSAGVPVTPALHRALKFLPTCDSIHTNNVSSEARRDLLLSTGGHKQHMWVTAHTELCLIARFVVGLGSSL